MAFQPLDPESSVSTNFTTWARQTGLWLNQNRVRPPLYGSIFLVKRDLACLQLCKNLSTEKFFGRLLIKKQMAMVCAMSMEGQGRPEPREAWLQEIECWIDERIGRALASRNTAKLQELKALHARLERIAKRIEMLQCRKR